MLSIGNSGWFGPIVCIVVIAVVFITMWWLTRTTMKKVDEEDVVESFTGTAASVTHGEKIPTPADIDMASMGLNTSNSLINTKNNYKQCTIPEKIRSLKKEILDALPGGMLTVDDNNNNIVKQDNYAKFGLNFILSKDNLSKDSTQISSECKLRAYVFFTYELSGQLYADIRSITFSVDANTDGRVFVPIDCNVIDRKRAASARIIRLLIEFEEDEDSQSSSNSPIGIEKVTVVTFGAEDNTNVEQTYKQTAIVPQGKRIRYGVLQVDPVMLVSNNHYTSTYHLPRAQALLGNVIYGGYRTPYPMNSTKTYRMRLRFNKTQKNNIHMYVIQLDPVQFENKDDILPLIQNASRLSKVSDSNATDINVSGFDESQLITADASTTGGSSNQQATNNDIDNDIEQKPLRRENVTKVLFLENVKSEKEYECTFACADTRMTQGHSKTRIYLLDGSSKIISDTQISRLEIVPMNAEVDSENKSRKIENENTTGNFFQFNNSKLDEHTEGRLCTDYIVDGDASIYRFNQDPLHKPNKTFSLCTNPKKFDVPITVNDGWMYTGTLRLPLVHPLADENRLLHMKIQTTARATFDFTISRIGAYLHLNGQPVTMCKMKLTANVVKFSIYIYKNTFGISINNQQPITTGTSPKLHSLYYSAGRALTKDEMDTSRHLASYPKIKDILVKVDKETMIRSRFISAIDCEPRSIDLLKLTPDECETRLTRTPYVWSKSVNTESAVPVDLSKDVTDSISWQAELKGSDINEDIAEKENEVTSGEPGDVLNKVYPDAGETPIDTKTETAIPDRECHLVKMFVGPKPEPLVTVFLSSMSELYARQYEIQVRFDGCQSGPFDKRAPTYAFGDQTLFHIPSTSAGKIKEETRRVIIKCTLHKRRLRVCLFIKHGEEAPILMKSFSHEISFDLQSNINDFPKLYFDKKKVSSIVCADRATSTLCNPYSLEEDKKKPTCKINPIGGTPGNPNYRLTDFPITASVEHAMKNKYTNYACSQTSQFSTTTDDDEECLKEAKKKFPQGYVTHVPGGSNTQNSCDTNCMMGDGSCKLVDMEGEQDSYTTYSFYNNADVVEQVAQSLR